MRPYRDLIAGMITIISIITNHNSTNCLTNLLVVTKTVSFEDLNVLQGFFPLKIPSPKRDQLTVTIGDDFILYDSLCIEASRLNIVDLKKYRTYSKK